MLTNTTLWSNIEQFSIDDASANFPFSKKLAKEQNWTADFTQKAIVEYKKFMYLCCISPNGASPSKVVDAVWHLHLTYTVNYWELFCGTILGQKIHHHPSNGNSSDKTRYEQREISTINLYEEEFGYKAPSDFWKNKTATSYLTLFKKIGFILLFVVLFLTGCKSVDSDILVGSFVILIMIGLSLLRINKNPNNATKDNNSTGCGGGCGTSCSSGCGGGCGGCGGCGS